MKNICLNVHRATGQAWTGSYPIGYLKKVERIYGRPEKPLHLFSGMVKSSFSVDINNKLKPSVCAECSVLPFRDNSFDRIYADPPYDENFTIHYSEFMTTPRTMPKFQPYSFVKECYRILKPGGLLIILHWLVYAAKFGFKTIDVLPVNQGPNHRIRAATVMRKPYNLDSFTQNTLDREGLS